MVSRSARNDVMYGSPHRQATVNEYGYPAMRSSTDDTPVAVFLANQWRFGIPPKRRMSYFAEGTRGTWTWLAESWHTIRDIHYALVYVNQTTDLLAIFTYPVGDAAEYNPVVSFAVRSFQP